MKPISTPRHLSQRARARVRFGVSLGVSCLFSLPGLALAQPELADPADPSAPADTTVEPAMEPEPAAAPEATMTPGEAGPTPLPEADPAAAAGEPEPYPKKKPPKYSIPFQLRPVLAVNVLRSDTSLAFYENPAGESGTTVASMLLFSHRITEAFAPLIRLGLVSNSPPDVPAGATPAAPESSTGFLNPVVGATYALNPVQPLRIGLFLGLTAPIGTGGGNGTDLDKRSAREANGRGILARSAMDNAMFAVNYFTVFPGVGIAYVDHGFTLQGEATLLQLTRVRGDEAPNDSEDDSRTNLTLGVHAGYFFAPFLSAAVELRHQRWLSTPAMVENNAPARDNTTFAFGPRFHIEVADKKWLRPAISLALPLDNTMKDAEYKIVQLDVPFLF